MRQLIVASLPYSYYGDGGYRHCRSHPAEVDEI